ncbi:heavy metal translocating P-type ATPase [Thermotoga profunda]|uniref:heavy metal translocating P-type ATPase n=1 Tax=Thermotoga profunda TaxID=1508420 RepID=UPI000597017E|nr:heavy metal translocating P-type ATPase [Thermotoga profunda]
MRKRYQLENLHCPDCAAKIEKVLSKTEGVRKVNLNFSLGVLDVDSEYDIDVEKIIHSVEDDIKIVESNKRKYVEFLPLLFAVVLLILSITLNIWYLLILTYLLAGYDVLLRAFKNIKKGFVLDENFLMSIATIGAIFLKQYEEAVAVMILYKIGELLQQMAVNRSRRSIKSLVEAMPKQAWLVQNSQLQRVDPKDLEVGQMILVKPGEKVPVDGIVVEGSSYLDVSPITGESTPRYVTISDKVPAGVIVKEKSIKLQVLKKYEDSSMTNIIKLVEDAAERKAKTEKFITVFARYYTPVVVSLAIFTSFVIPLLTGQSVKPWINRGLILLVISCPCALVLAIPLAYFAAIGKLSKNGVLVKGATFLDVLANIKNVVFDKTGTLTHGDFEISKINGMNGFSQDEILMYSAHAEVNSNHPVARSIVKAFPYIDHSAVKDFHEINGLGVRCSVNGKVIHVGNDKLLHLEQIPHPQDVCDLGKESAVHVAIDKEYAGNIYLNERLKKTSEKAVKLLQERGINVHILTGDGKEKTSTISERLYGINYHAQLLPENKLEILENKIMKTGKTAFVGDGINDTPALARADVGMAMNGFGNDAAIEVADVVVMSGEPIKVVESIDTARFTKKIVLQNIIFAIAMKSFFIILAIAGKATMWEGVFADTGVALLCTINSMRILLSRKKVG